MMQSAEGEGAGLELLYRSPEVSALTAADALRPLAQDQRLSVPEPAVGDPTTLGARRASQA